MAIRKTAAVAALTATATQLLGTVSLGAPYALVLGFQAANWASAAKAAEGVDTLLEVKLVDADGLIVFLDAADFDYGATSGVAPSTNGSYKLICPDETAGATWTPVDDSGAAMSSQGSSIGVPAKSPITVTVLNGGTATDYFEVSLYVAV
jgi:hypothetical protein